MELKKFSEVDKLSNTNMNRMPVKPVLHNHAIERVQERFGLDDSWLMEKLDSGHFVWLRGTGNSGDAKFVRSGHLIYIPEKNEYCVVVMDDRKRLAVTVLTEEMARHSSWRNGLDETAKLRAKRIALGEEIVDDCNFLRLFAEERGRISLTLVVRAFTKSWQLTTLILCKVEIEAEQIDPDLKKCQLTYEQEQEAIKCVLKQINEKTILPYCDFYVQTGKGRRAQISNVISGTSSLEEGETARRVSKYLSD